MEKPKPKPSEPVYDYHELIRYIEEKYNYDSRDFDNKYGGRKDKPKGTRYLDFWHWFSDHGDTHNGCFKYIPFDYIEDTETPDFVRTILKDIQTEFDPEKQLDNLKVWVEW